MTVKRFKLTKDHLKLLRRFNVSWQDAEFGAPAIDPKRPYGNSGVTDDIHKILTGRDDLTENEHEYYKNLHLDMQTALQIVLATGKFKAGTYECGEYDYDGWKLVNK